ncbi:MAG: type II toxin-antitoxin system VapC family toxin [Deltaproteobacteria bacterium]|nr:type II toxin-antitoxin system VapC family toxin [Deltaproteobacteria bacterium]
MGYLIDTCIWVDVERGALAPADIADHTKNEPVFISPITLAELKFGAEITQQPDLKQKRLAAVHRLMNKPILRIDEATGIIFGTLAAALKKTGRGHEFRIQDLWMASQCVQHNISLITHNLKDFKDIPGLEILLIGKSQK